MNSIGILTIATNRYLDYWKDLVLTIRGSSDDSITLHLFTDRFEEAEEFASTITHVSIQIHKISSLAWPLATLLRYEIYTDHAHLLDQEILMHLDADSIQSEGSTLLLTPRPWNAGLVFVQHPGFFRPRLGRGLIKYYSAPRRALADLRRLLKVGGIGDWETRKVSRAFVSRAKRNIYCCGGCWFGFKKQFIDFCSLQATLVQQDLANNIVPKWHDESYLNRFVSENNVTVTTPEYCFDPSYIQLAGISPIFIAIDKGMERV